MTNLTMEIEKAIISEMEDELLDRNYDCSTRALNKIVDTWFERKHDLIELLSKHPLWNPEKFMIQFDTDLEREIETHKVNRFVSWLRDNVGGNYNWNSSYQTDNYYVCNFIASIDTQFFDDTYKERIDDVNSYNKNYKLRTNMKASKAIGKICREEGWDKLPDFNKEYAAVCDALNPLKVTRHTVISLHPVDFLLMSNGNSWSSCHYIDWADEDPGCYSAGTISYMLDRHSFLFYTVDASYNGDEIERHKKLQRQVFGYNDEVLAQLRLYPQSCDSGAEHVYDNIRAIVQKVVAECLDKPNYWMKSKKDVEEVCRKGAGAQCYPDWRKCNPGGEHCSISTLKDRENGKEDREIVFGARPICIECGCEHTTENNINCCNSVYYECEDCGCRIHEDDVYWYNDRAYCGDCVTYCEDCEEYVPDRYINVIDDANVCDHCLEHGDYYRCEECGDLHYIDCLIETYDGDYYCEDCAEKVLRKCADCKDTYYKDDLIYDEVTDKYYCDDCYACLLEERELEETA